MKNVVLAVIACVALSGIVVFGPGSAEAFVYVCGPLSLPLGGGANSSSATIYNASLVTANVAAKFLHKNGTNLSGTTPQGQSGTYPGQKGRTTVAIAAGNSLVLSCLSPTTNADNIRPGSAVTLRVVSDQPIAVNWASTGSSSPTPCNFVHP